MGDRGSGKSSLIQAMLGVSNFANYYQIQEETQNNNMAGSDTFDVILKCSTGRKLYCEVVSRKNPNQITCIISKIQFKSWKVALAKVLEAKKHLFLSTMLLAAIK